MKAFVGHSFEKKDSPIVAKIIKFLESAGVECQTGERVENKSGSKKIKERIRDSDIFVGIFTCDKKIVKNDGEGLSEIKKDYTTSNWVIQESGFAIGCNKKLILLVEREVYKFPELQGDLDVIYFDRTSLEDTFSKINQMVESIKSDEWGSLW